MSDVEVPPPVGVNNPELARALRRMWMIVGATLLVVIVSVLAAAGALYFQVSEVRAGTAANRRFHACLAQYVEDITHATTNADRPAVENRCKAELARVDLP